MQLDTTGSVACVPLSWLQLELSTPAVLDRIKGRPRRRYQLSTAPEACTGGSTCGLSAGALHASTRPCEHARAKTRTAMKAHRGGRSPLPTAAVRSAHATLFFCESRPAPAEMDRCEQGVRHTRQDAARRTWARGDYKAAYSISRRAEFPDASTGWYRSYTVVITNNESNEANTN